MLVTRPTAGTNVAVTRSADLKLLIGTVRRHRELMTFRRLKRRPNISNVFDSAFALEILKSDKLRVSILLGTWISILTVLFLLSFAFTGQFQSAFHGKFYEFRKALIIGSAVTCGSLVLELLALER